MKNTKTNELAGVDTWVKKAAPEFLTILLTVFIYFYFSSLMQS
jgi:hypothetical protein